MSNSQVMRGKAADMIGKRFGRLVVQGRHDKRLHGRYVTWECLCDCGNLKLTSTQRLNTGRTKSCGCLQAENMPPVLIKHGMSHYSGFKVWQSMIRRCKNPLDKDYKYYGGRGIDVCERWLDPREFAKDMGERPDGYSLDRIDTNGHYCPQNCRWATPAQQGANKRNNRLIEHDGQTLHLSEWCRRLDVKLSTVVNRLNAGMDPSLALTMPSRRKRKAK